MSVAPLLQFLGPACELEVNLDAKSTAALQARLDAGDIDADMFNHVVATAEKELAGDAMPRFVKSPQWQRVLSSEGSAPGHAPVPAPAPAPSKLKPALSARSLLPKLSTAVAEPAIPKPASTGAKARTVSFVALPDETPM